MKKTIIAHETNKLFSGVVVKKHKNKHMMNSFQCCLAQTFVNNFLTLQNIHTFILPFLSVSNIVITTNYFFCYSSIDSTEPLQGRVRR